MLDYGGRVYEVQGDGSYRAMRIKLTKQAKRALRKAERKNNQPQDKK